MAAVTSSAGADRLIASYDVVPEPTAVPKALPRILKIWAAKYDGRVLTLDVEVPGPGRLSLKIPTTCRTGSPADCHKKTSVVREASQRGHLMIRRTMSVRLDSFRRLKVLVRMEMPDGLIVSALKPKVHSIARLR